MKRHPLVSIDELTDAFALLLPREKARQYALDWFERMSPEEDWPWFYIDEPWEQVPPERLHEYG